ncbi:apoptosis inhibitory protein 5-domain-containing protein [Lipomyces oligophaga]|uniref:apoptosis inhibitory protein 5-domain-containing protein n=1 Tax=Lipomyces oligophaga TaxID=45792 RepID=UPI0034CE60BD
MAEFDHVENIYKLYDVAKGINGSSAEEALQAYSEILAYSKPTLSKNAHILAKSFIPDLFSSFAREKSVASKAIESMIDFCEDEDVKIRTEAIRKLPDMVLMSTSDSDKDLVMDILIQLLQSQTPAELQAVQSSFDKLSTALPEIASKQLWAFAASADEPALQSIAVNILISTVKSIGNSLAYAKDGIKSIISINDKNIINKLLPSLLSVAAMKGGDDPAGTALLTELLDALVARAPVQSAHTNSNQEALDFIAFLPKWVVNILNRNASSSSLITYLASIAFPAILSNKLTNEREVTHLLRLAVESCASGPQSPEIPILIPKLKDLAIKYGSTLREEALDSDSSSKVSWPILEPLTIALYISMRRCPTYPLSTENSLELTPALRSICYEAQLALPNLRKEVVRLTADIDAWMTAEKTRLQCNNVLEVTREMLKLATLRSATPPTIKFSWRPNSIGRPVSKPRPKRAVPIPIAAEPASVSGEHRTVRLKRRSSALESVPKNPPILKHVEKKPRAEPAKRGRGGRKKR